MGRRENLLKHPQFPQQYAEPSKAELGRLEELKKIITEEEKEINRLTKGSKQLKEKVVLELQNKIENAGGERLKSQKAKVNKIQNANPPVGKDQPPDLAALVPSDTSSITDVSEKILYN
ncbi:hypothetical protein L1887_38623 [Cichorium endivia]|nr:hypothetical protein L1887_38623 [Cichorium endivia]